MTTPAFIPDNPTAQPSVAPSAAAPGFIPDTQGAAPPSAPSTDPSVTGELTNDVGNKVIVPKDGEEFGDTIKRAIAYHHSLTPQQQQEAMDKETSTIPKKTGETVGGAAVMGFLGPALLAAPGEALMETHAAVSAGIKALLPALTTGTVAVGKWAAEHPIAAKAIYNTIKWAIQGTSAGAAAKIAGKIIDAAPE